MFVKTQTHTEMEVLKWLALVILAGAIALLLANTAKGDRATDTAGKTIGAGMTATEVARPPATPLEALPEVESPEVGANLDPMLPLIQPAAPAEDPFLVASETWNAIELQRAGRMDEAVEAWTRLRLPAENDVWRLIAWGHAYLQLADYDKAAEVLSEAKYAAPDNAVLDYVIGTLWLAKAESALEWHDAPGIDASRLVAWQPMEIAPNTASMYRLAAVMCFERATKLANQVNLAEPLLSGEWMVPESDELAMPVATPTVYDLLSAFGADRFEGRSHLALGVLHTQRDVLDHAERHLDRAGALHEPTGAAFRDLAERFEQRGQYGDAMRVFLKSLSHGGGIDTFGKALENGGKALLR